ncbi:MAG: NAD(P)H-quinone oxidoreductase [Alphaproteobacteria bacterium]|nr:NAD(P)H-quinone oxidoreductase [Alphaproteobacteria bacterium]
MTAETATALPATSFRAMRLAGIGGPEMLVPVVRPLPAPGPNELLVRVAAAGVNRADLQQRIGEIPLPEGHDVPGLEVAGHVLACGPGAARFRPGDAVCALLAAGGYADHAIVPEPQAMALPPGLSLTEAAVLPEAWMTAYVNLFEHGGFRAGETVLVHGGTSGVGSALIQLVAAFGGRAIATAGGAEKCAACLGFGAARAIDHRAEDFVAVARAETGGVGVDLLMDVVGAPYLSRNLAAIRQGGRVVQIGLVRGRMAEIDLLTIMLKHAVLTGSALRHRTVAEKGRLARLMEERLWPLFAAGRLRVPLDRTYPLAEAGAALTRMEASAHIGKIVLIP